MNSCKFSMLSVFHAASICVIFLLFPLCVSGAWTVTFNGTSDQTIAASGDAFYNLTLNNAGSAFTINGDLDTDNSTTGPQNLGTVTVD